MNLKQLVLLPGICLLALLGSCDKKTADTETVERADEAAPLAQRVQLDSVAASIWWQQGGEILAHCLLEARKLQVKISDFLDTPDAEKLQASQLAWTRTNQAYKAFYAHRFIALNDPDTFSILAGVDFRIGAWPIQPGSLDSFGAYLYSGLVHDIGAPLTMENLLTLHGQVDSENATLGLFALEYMLFGENNSRNIKDYVALTQVTAEYKERGFSAPSELPNNRRRLLIALQAGKLVEDIHLLVSTWNTEQESSQQSTWQALTEKHQHGLISAAFERGLAQLLVSAEEQSKIDELIAALQALRPLPALIGHNETNAIEATFTDLDKLLQTGETTEPIELDWQETINRITSLSKLFSAPPPEENPAPEITKASPDN